MGQDISGACGQLVVNFEAAASSGGAPGLPASAEAPAARSGPSDIEDFSPIGSASSAVPTPAVVSEAASARGDALPGKIRSLVEQLSWLFLLVGLLGLCLRLLGVWLPLN
jgi:hypothetical protein